MEASPVLLEPIVSMKITVDDKYTGDILGDLNKRRGRVNGIEAWDGKKGYQIITADVPKAEMNDYTIALRAMSQGKGTVTFYFLKYEEAPAPIAQKIIAEAGKNQ